MSERPRTVAAGVLSALVVVVSLLAATPADAAVGDLESTWADGGVLVLSSDLGPLRGASHVASTPEGQLYIAGGDIDDHACVTRLSATGELDPEFSATPDLIGSVCDLDDTAAGGYAAMQGTGVNVVAAAVLPDSRRVVRLNQWGGIPGMQDLAPSYAGSGGRILDVTALSDGRTALLETRATDGPGWVTILESAGGQFVGDWQVPSLDASHRFRPQQVLPAPGGKVMLVGELDGSAGPTTVVLRTDAEGRPDTTFSTDGFSVGPASSPSRPGRGALGLGGTVLLAAVHGTDIVVRRVTATGAVDTTFTTTGRTAVAPGDSDRVSALVLRDDGRIFLVLGSGDPTSTVHVARLTKSGVLDTTFSADGFAAYDAGTGHARRARSGALALDGDLYVLADDPGAVESPEVVRFDGSTDTPPPVPVMTGPTRPWTLSSTVRLSWTTSDASPLITSDLRVWHSRSSSPLPEQPTSQVTASTARSRTFTDVPGGNTVCGSARARDSAGQLSAWSIRRCTAVPLTPGQLAGKGGFSSTAVRGTYSGKVLEATRRGATVSRSGVTVKRLALVVTTCARCGKVAVRLGPTLLRTVSLKSPVTRKKVVIEIASFSSIRAGKVKVVVVSSGKKVLVEGLGLSTV
jgi:uncharacterized delta-60 repeat protein